jgi:multidrug resistance efflux pump
MSTVDETTHTERKSEGRMRVVSAGDALPPALQRPEPATLAPVLQPAKRLKVLPLGIASGVVAFGILLYFVTRSASPEKIPLTPAAFSDSGVLHELGSIEALLEYPVLARVTGTIVWKCDDGILAEQDEPIIRFDTKTVEEDIEAREKDVEDRKQNVKDALDNLNTSRERYKWQIRNQEIALELAELDRKKVLDYPTEDEKLDVELSLKLANLDLESAQLDATSHQELFAKSFVSEAVLKKVQQNLAGKKVNYAKSRLIRDLTLQGNTTDMKRQADLAVADAKKRLQIIKFNSGADATVLAGALEVAQIDLENAERELVKKQQELERATVRAPARGRVAFVDVWKGSKSLSPIQVGESRQWGWDLCKVCDVSRMRIRININETDVHRVKVGHRATVTLAAFPGRTFKCVVSELGVMAMDKNIALSGQGGPAVKSAGEAFVNVVTAKLDFLDLSEEERQAIRIEFTADVLIHVNETPLPLPTNVAGVKK